VRFADQCLLGRCCCIQIEKNRKYAKWKAAYIHNCLKNGETPISGPLPDDEEFGEAAGGAAG